MVEHGDVVGREQRRRRRHRLRALAIAAWFVVLTIWGVTPLFAWLVDDLPVPLMAWVEGTIAPSPDGALRAIEQQGDEGALGYGPARVVVTSTRDPAELAVAFVSPNRLFDLEPRFTGARTLEVIVHCDREPTRDELRESRRKLAVAGATVDVSIVWKERGAP